MKKIYSIIWIWAVFFSVNFFGQTSTETFETEAHNNTSFTDNGVVFNIISNNSGIYQSIFAIQGNFPGTGWNGTSNDNGYIDNSKTPTKNNGSFSIKTSSNLFKVNSFWVFLSNAKLNQNIIGSLTVTGKLNGVTKFIQTKFSGFATSMGSTNGFTLIDMSNINGLNYTNIIIDELQITLGGSYTYCMLDAFSWVKESTLSTQEVEKEKLKIYPNPTNGLFNIEIKEKTKISIYNSAGNLIRITDVKKGSNPIDITEFPKGIYIVKTESESYKIIKK